MDLLIKQATIVDKGNDFHGQKVDVLIRQGKIEKIAKSIKAEDVETFEADNLHLSKGWIDLQANFQDPGYEYKEDLESGIKAAAAGGFTKVCLSPLSDPIRDSKAQIEYVYNRTKNTAVELLPYGAISKQAEGKELAELHDMKQAGAIAFSDGKRPVKNPNLLHRALLYTQSFDGLVMNFPHTRELAVEGVMNEGEVSTQLGLKGVAELTEELMISRDLYLVDYTNGRLHFSTISSAEGVKLIERAQKAGAKVSCDVSSAHLLLDDSQLEEFDSRFKTLPPFRNKSTIKALIKGIKKGVINAISSDHWPEDIESKKKEFDYAAFGIINIQTAFAAANTALKNDS
jgi:dihydroorotase